MVNFDEIETQTKSLDLCFELAYVASASDSNYKHKDDFQPVFLVALNIYLAMHNGNNYF